MAYRLPSELVLKIVEYAYYDEERRPDIITLYACSSVSKQWCTVGRRLLFHEVRKSALDWNLPKIAHNPSLGAYIRSLRLTVTHSNQTAFADTVSFSPQLYELTLAIDLHRFDKPVLDRLGSLSRCIKALVVMRCGVMSPAVYELITLWPTIRFLRLHSELIHRPPATRPEFSLYELSLHHDLRLPTFEWFLPSPPDNASPPNGSALRILELRQTPGPSVHNHIAAHAPYVRSLRLMIPPPSGFFDSFTGLEELVLRYFPRRHPDTPLPNTTQHIHFQIHQLQLSASFQFVIPSIELLPSLRLVTVSDTMTGVHDFHELETACEERNIPLRIDTSRMDYVVCWLVNTCTTYILTIHEHSWNTLWQWNISLDCGLLRICTTCTEATALNLQTNRFVVRSSLVFQLFITYPMALADSVPIAWMM